MNSREFSGIDSDNMGEWRGLQLESVSKYICMAGAQEEGLIWNLMKDWKMALFCQALHLVKPCPLCLLDWQWKDLELSWRTTALDCVTYSNLFRLSFFFFFFKEKNNVAKCSGKEKSADSYLVTIRETIDVPKDSINNLLILLWKTESLSLSDYVWF